MSKATKDISTFDRQGELFSLGSLSARKVQVSFSSPDTSCYGGLLLLREVESQTRVIETLCKDMVDNRHKGYVRHSYKELLTQRIMQISAGYEDAADCDLLRKDSVLKMCTNKSPESSDLASQPTMSRLENTITKSELYKMACSFILLFINSYESAPKTIVLDIDDSNFNTYGNQQYTLFNNYYDEYCYMPFFIFEGLSGKLILPLLRPGRRSKDLNVYGILRRVIEMLRKYWKKTTIIIRGDSLFCNDSVMSYCEQNKDLYYLTGMIGFNPLKQSVDNWVKEAEVTCFRAVKVSPVFHSLISSPICEINISESIFVTQFVTKYFKNHSKRVF